MAFPMFATAIWLIWVFAQQTSSTDLVILMGLILVMGLGYGLAGHEIEHNILGSV